MKNVSYSIERIKYLKNKRKEKFFISFFRIALLVVFLGIWELLALLEVIDPFITSSPSRIFYTIRDLFVNDNFSYHIGITLYETILGFLFAVIIGYIVALLLWWSEKLRKIFCRFKNKAFFRLITF